MSVACVPGGPGFVQCISSAVWHKGHQCATEDGVLSP